MCISLPVWPPEDSFSSSYPPLSRWHIEIIGGEIRESFYTNKEKITVKVKKNRPFCLLAEPITLLQDGNECSYFKPAGFIYPAAYRQTESASNRATWEQGFPAHLIKTLFNEGLAENLSPVEIEYLVSTFNWKKAIETIDKKLNSENQLSYNPWLLSTAPLLEGIISQSFRTSLLNISACAAVKQSDLPEGIFLSSFIPENLSLSQKNQFTVPKNTPFLIGDGQKYGILITYKTAKNISLAFIYLPIYIEDI